MPSLSLPGRARAGFAASLLLALGACTSAAPPPGADPAAQDSRPGSGGERYPFGLACGWEFASHIDTMNVAFPDASAKYWVALVPMLPQSRLRIDGRYPDVRYFSYNVYDPILRPTDAIADFQIAPQAGGRNPFSDAAATRGDAYTAYLEFSAAPEARAPNTIYAGSIALGPGGAPQLALTALIYRVYVPAEGLGFDGGVGLPLLTLETADGETELVPTADCVESLLPTLGGALPEPGINAALEGLDVIDDPFLQSPAPLPVGDARAETRVFYGLPSTAINLLRGFLGLPIPQDAEHNLPLPAGGGFLSNIHNAYTTNLFSRSYGNVVMIRARAPSWRGQGGVPFGAEQLRYWSVCENDLATQRYVACVADHQAHLDAQGYYTMMVSDAADRPANARAESAVDWMPWGPYADALLIYRHMLPGPGFAQSIHNVPQFTPPIEVMGEYLPQSAYCRREIVEAAGDSAAQIFAACRAYTQSLQGNTP